MWTIFKVFIEFVAVLFLFYVLVFLALRPVGSWLPDQGLNPYRLHWKVESWPQDCQGSPWLKHSVLLFSSSLSSAQWAQSLPQHFTEALAFSRLAWEMCVNAQSCPTLCNHMDCSPPGSSVHGIFQARILEQVATSCSRGSSQPRDQTRTSFSSCIGRQIFYHGAIGLAYMLSQFSEWVV